MMHGTTNIKKMGG